jgi:CubicO group peptidase (beta-lactamase class C family)
MPAATIDHAALDTLFEPYDRTDAPGYAVGVALPGQRAYRRGFGMASIELPVALSPTIRMRIGSTTKHMTALAVLLLAEEGKLDLDASPRRILPELPDWAEAMTLRQLLAHTSGMRDSMDLLLHSAGAGIPTEPNFLLRATAALDSVNFAPGTSWNYNNGGYVLAAEIVARLGGLSFADFLHQRIFTPLGMHDTLVRPLDTDLLPNSATLHVPAPEGGYVRGVFGTPIGGEGGVVSTVDDMLLWLRHMSAPTVGRPESWQALRTPLTTHGYGLGLMMDSYRGVRRVQHAGAVVGGSCQMVKVEDCDLDIIIMSNGRSSLEGYRLVEAIIDACIEDLAPPPQHHDGPLIVGRYHSQESGRYLTLGEKDGAQTISLGAFTLPARRDEAGALTLPFLPTDMQVLPAPDGDSLTVSEYGLYDRLTRLPPPAEIEATTLVGQYESHATALTATITLTPEAAPCLTITGPVGAMSYALTPVTPQLWEARATGVLPLAALLELDDQGFRFSTGRTVRLAFART